MPAFYTKRLEQEGQVVEMTSGTEAWRTAKFNRLHCRSRFTDFWVTFFCPNQRWFKRGKKNIVTALCSSDCASVTIIRFVLVSPFYDPSSNWCFEKKKWICFSDVFDSSTFSFDGPHLLSLSCSCYSSSLWVLMNYFTGTTTKKTNTLSPSALKSDETLYHRLYYYFLSSTSTCGFYAQATSS